jgi:hypothetical protein
MVNTFLVCSDFTESAKQLDNKRLGKQRVEAFQLLKILHSIEHECSLVGIHIEDIPSSDNSTIEERSAFVKRLRRAASLRDPLKKFGWWHHPALRMWLGHRLALEEYLRCHIQVWIERGFANTMLLPSEKPKDFRRPQWTLDAKFHTIHRQALYSKSPVDYMKFISEGTFEAYWWP